MDKVLIDKFLDAMKKEGVTKYWLDCKSKGISLCHDGEYAVIELKDDYVVWIEKTRNLGHPTGQFNMQMLPYEYIDAIRTNDIGFVETVNMAKTLDSFSSDAQKYFENVHMRYPMTSNPRGAGEGPYLDKDGNDTLPPHRPGIVTTS